MKIIILAAGEGKRMWPVVQEKYLLPFLGKPLIHYNLQNLSENSRIDEFIIITKRASEERISQIARDLGLKFKIAIQDEPKGMADAILSAEDLIDGPILVLNAEDILDEKVYGDVLADAENTEADAFFAGIRFEKYFPGGYLKLDADKVLGIVEKPGEGNEPSNLVKLVVDYFRDGKQLIECLKKVVAEKDDQYELALGQLIADGLNVRVSDYFGVWLPLKYPWHILDISAHFLSRLQQKISPTAKIAKTALIEGPVVIEDGVKVFEGAVIKGPVFIGKNCIIGNNCLIRESIIEANSVIGFSSDITRSYIGANSWFHTNYIGDSVLESDCGMGSGAVLANLRLDNQTVKVGEDRMDTNRTKLGLIAGKGVRVGVNASTMPGVRVGAGSLVGPGVVLKRDLGENKKVVTKEESLGVEDYQSAPTSYDQFRDKLK